MEQLPGAVINEFISKSDIEDWFLSLRLSLSLFADRQAYPFVIPACPESFFKNDSGQARMTQQKKVKKR